MNRWGEAEGRGPRSRARGLSRVHEAGVSVPGNPEVGTERRAVSSELKVACDLFKEGL